MHEGAVWAAPDTEVGVPVTMPDPGSPLASTPFAVTALGTLDHSLTCAPCQPLSQRLRWATLELLPLGCAVVPVTCVQWNRATTRLSSPGLSTSQLLLSPEASPFQETSFPKRAAALPLPSLSPSGSALPATSHGCAVSGCQHCPAPPASTRPPSPGWEGDWNRGMCRGGGHRLSPHTQMPVKKYTN